MTAEQDRIQREAARGALRGIGQAWTLNICPICEGISDRDGECEACRKAPIRPVVTLAALVGLAMTI